MLTETQTPALLCQQLSDYVVHTIPATSTDKAGEGFLLPVKTDFAVLDQSLADRWANSTIWLTLKPPQSQQQPLTLEVCYVPSESSRSAQLSSRSAAVRFESLAAHLSDDTASGHVLLAGDFNARVLATLHSFGSRRFAGPPQICRLGPASRPAATLTPRALTMS